MLRLALILVALLFAPGAARAEDEMPEPPRPFPELGRLLGTSGTPSIDGAAGGGLVPWAMIAGHGSRDAVGADVGAIGARLTDVSFGALGIGVGLYDRLELTWQHQWLETRAAGARLGLGHGYLLEQDVFGAKLRLFGDIVADQDRWWPQVSIGVQHKVSGNATLVRALGARDSEGTDFYVAASRLFLAEGLLVNATLRATRANQFGLLGHGGDRQRGYSLQVEASAALLLSRRVAIGAEIRTRPDNLGFAREDAAYDLFAAWFVDRSLTLVLAYADLGRVARQGRQNGVFLSLQAGF
jgi:hypothetical protein